MQSMIHKGIHFCGAILNIDHDTVSLNFQSAWSIGYLARINSVI